MTAYETVKSCVLIALCGLAAIVAISVTTAIDKLTDPDRGVVAVVDQRAALVEADAKQSIDAALAKADGRISDAIALVDRTRRDADTRTGEALGIVRGLADPNAGVVAVLDRRAAAIEDDLGSQLGTANHTLALTADQLTGPQGSVTRLASRYTLLPDQFAGSASWISLEPEITCRHADGSGYGGCMRARINGLLGEAERTGAEITKDSPQFLGQVTGIATDVHTFTKKATGPRGFWGTFRDLLSTGSGVVRAAGAAGVF